MQFKKIYLENLGATIELMAYEPEGKTAEWHAMLHVEPRGEAFQGQFRRICQAEAHLMGLADMIGAITAIEHLPKPVTSLISAIFF